MSNLLKQSNVGNLLATDENQQWILATLEQVNIWNWFVSQPEILGQTVKRISKYIGENIVSIDMNINQPYNNIIGVANPRTGMRYKLAPISLKYILTKNQPKLDCVCPCECGYAKNRK